MNADDSKALNLMWRIMTDENYPTSLIAHLRQRFPDLDLVRVQDVGLSGKLDPMILEWAAQERRILLTRDLATMPTYAYERIAKNLPMSGVLAHHKDTSQAKIFEDLCLIIEGSSPDECQDRVIYLPL